MAIPRTARTTLDLIDAIRVSGAIDSRSARQVAPSLRLLLEARSFGPGERVVRRRARLLRRPVIH